MVKKINPPTCSVLPQEADYTGVDIVEVTPPSQLEDYMAAMEVARKVAQERLEDAMLLAWYDRDRDFESPQHASECHVNTTVPGYVDYALYHGATLKVDIEQGRFVFFFLSTEL